MQGKCALEELKSNVMKVMNWRLKGRFCLELRCSNHMFPHSLDFNVALKKCASVRARIRVVDRDDL